MGSLYAQRRAAGLCVRCTAPAIPGRDRCLDCRRDAAAWMRAHRPFLTHYTCGLCGGEGHNRRTCTAATEGSDA